MDMKEKIINVAEVEAVIRWIKNWFENESGNAKGIIIGISGGKDSAICGKLCVDAIGADKVFGVLMPNGIQKDINDSLEVCKLLGIKYRIVNIEDAYSGIVNAIKYEHSTTANFFPLSSHTLTNVPPRLRMIVLYAIGQEMGYRVCGTGNASESFVGYDTKHGDNACDFNPIANFHVDEVMAMGETLGLPHAIAYKTPSDGLCGKSDEDNLGFTYAEVKAVSKGLSIENDAHYGDIMKSHNRNSHKFSMPPVYER